MKKYLLAAFMMLLNILGINAQSETQPAPQPEKNSRKSNPKTAYTYTDRKGRVHSVYVSKNGRTYIKRVSCSGHPYWQYVNL